MKTTRFHFFFALLSAAWAFSPVQSARADESTTHIALSDPSKPAVLRIRLWHGEVKVRGADVKDITVKTDSNAAEPPTRPDGMRVLSASPSYRFSESHNVVSLEYGSGSWGAEPADVELTVPVQTSIVVANSIRGDFECNGLSGDIDVRTMDGSVKAEDVSGGVCIESMNGEIAVDMRALAANRPLSLSSMNGRITIRLPSTSKAAIRFRTHHGVILTNFDAKALVTRTDLPRHGEGAEERAYQKDLLAHSDAAPVPPASPGTPVAPVAPVSSDKEPADSDSEDDWHADVRDSIRVATEEAALAARDAATAVHESLAEVHAELSKLPPLPPMTGGKVVSGTLNGGGVEIQAATLNGDIVLKKGD